MESYRPETPKFGPPMVNHKRPNLSYKEEFRQTERTFPKEWADLYAFQFAPLVSTPRLK